MNFIIILISYKFYNGDTSVRIAFTFRFALKKKKFSTDFYLFTFLYLFTLTFFKILFSLYRS